MGFPRVRGDVPTSGFLTPTRRRFSPRARGCSAARSPRGRNCSVFPACAGMFRRDGVMLGTFSCFPRVRGDVPYIKIVGPILIPFSPRARGCSSDYLPLLNSPAVFPACAGMFRRAAQSCNFCQRFPRVRGDVPSNPTQRETHHTFSPRARGCSVVGLLAMDILGVFPACAGMFRNPSSARPW